MRSWRMTRRNSAPSGTAARRAAARPPSIVLALLSLLAAVPPPATSEGERPPDEAGPGAGDHPGGRTLALGDGPVYVETEGSGPPLVVLPAGPGLDHAYFHPYLSSLAPYATVVYFDPRGCGRSGSRPPAEYTLEAMADDLEALRRELRFVTIDLLGHGMGQAVATLYADRHPERIGRLIFLGASRRAASFLDGEGLAQKETPDMRRALDRAESDRYLSADGRLRERFRILAPLMFHRLTDRAFHRAFVDQVTASAAVRGAMSDRLAAGAAGAADLSAPLGRLKAPLLIIAGRYDPTAPVAEAEALRDAVAGSRLAVLEESGSFPFAEQPVEFLRIVREFLGVAAGREGGSGAGGGI